MSKIKVVELFAGVGGFRVGLEGFSYRKTSKYKVVWSNQWEPNKQVQHAANIYRKCWSKNSDSDLSNNDINTIKPKI